MIDWTRLNDLRADIGEADFADVARLFVSEMRERLVVLAADPNAATGADFHFLRGSAANLGLSEMVAACNAAEAACRVGKTPDIAAVADAFATAIIAIATEIPGLSNNI
ncbi:Hpt domain-containing protein [Roseicyclus sp.]|uniref:Hpt domain-containing protein n=1 Tax=Roseicyclus sp. TaxID=1914329 RepID=UPI003F6C0FA5